MAVAGDTVNVAAADYREQVTLPTSGASGFPITFHAATGARVLGTNNLSGTALWTLESGSTTRYSTSFDPPSTTAQVFVDGVRLAGPMASASAVIANSFYFDDAGNRLYVDVGGGNPGSRAVEAGARSFGFLVEGKADLVIDGFEVRGHNTNAIRVQTVSRVTLRNNRLLTSASSVLAIQGTTTPTTSDHVTVVDNEVGGGADHRHPDARPRDAVAAAGQRRARQRRQRPRRQRTTFSRFTGNVFYANAKVGGGHATGMRLVTGSTTTRSTATSRTTTRTRASRPAAARTIATCSSAISATPTRTTASTSATATAHAWSRTPPPTT